MRGPFWSPWYIIIINYVIGATSTTHNVHMVVHLAGCVSNWGPLWAYSCFQFERKNHELKTLFRGTRNMTKQVWRCNLWCDHVSENTAVLSM